MKAWLLNCRDILLVKGRYDARARPPLCSAVQRRWRRHCRWRRRHPRHPERPRGADLNTEVDRSPGRAKPR